MLNPLEGALDAGYGPVELAAIATVVVLLLSAGALEAYLLTCLQLPHPAWIAAGMVLAFVRWTLRDLRKPGPDGA